MYEAASHVERRFRVWSLAGRGGQTLIELLVVISLVSLLIVTLIPSIRGSMKVARSAACKSNLHQVQLSLKMYALENGGRLPMLSPPPATIFEPTPVWFMGLYPTYLPDPIVLRCPEDPFGFRMTKVRHRMDDPSVGDYSSYGISSYIVSSKNGFLTNLERYRPTRPQDVILVADIGPDSARLTTDEKLVSGPSRHASLLRVDDGFDPFQAAGSAPWLTTRHRFGINVLTIDGGVREAHTTEVLRRPMAREYPSCAAGGCTLCAYGFVYHYSFARDRLFWWTGPFLSE